MNRQPQINIVTGDGITYAMVKKSLVAWYWLAGGRWFVAARKQEPVAFDSQAEAVKRFMDLAVKVPATTAAGGAEGDQSNGSSEVRMPGEGR